MRDEMDGRIWAEHHQEISAGLGRLLGGFAAGLKRLNDLQWSAPWRREARGHGDRPGHA